MRKVALRGLFVRKTRLALTTLAVALGVTLIAGTYVFTDTINHSFDKIFAVSFKGTDVVITPNDDLQSDNQSGPAPLDASLLDKVRRLPGVAEAEGSIFDQNGAILDRKGKPVGANGAPTFVSGTRRVQRFDSLQYAAGRPPRTADEVAIDKALADRKLTKIQNQLQTAQNEMQIAGFTGTPSFLAGPTGGRLQKLEFHSFTPEPFRQALDAALQSGT